jgi:hypothetical protein
VIGLQLVKQIPDQIGTKKLSSGNENIPLISYFQTYQKTTSSLPKNKKKGTFLIKINFGFSLIKVSLDDSLVDSKIYAKQSYLEDFFLRYLN